MQSTRLLIFPISLGALRAWLRVHRMTRTDDETPYLLENEMLKLLRCILIICTFEVAGVNRPELCLSGLSGRQP